MAKSPTGRTSKSEPPIQNIPLRTETGKRIREAFTETPPKHDHDNVLLADGSINVSQSKVKLWRSCRRAYYNKFVRKLRKKVVKRPFTFGSIVHKMIELWAEGDDPFEYLETLELEQGKFFLKQREIYGNIIQDVSDIMTEYFLMMETSGIKFVRRKGRSSEHEFAILLEPGLWFTGKIDAVVKAKQMLWAGEHKTFNKMMSEDDRWRSVQGASYLKALEMTGWPAIDGIFWDNISSKPPQMPAKTDGGKWSQARLLTTSATLKRWAEENGVKLKDYPKLQEHLAESRRLYFVPVFAPIRPRVVDNIWNDFVDTAKEIQEYHGKKKDMNIGRNCSGCDYEPLCRAEVHDLDVDFVVKREYTVEKDKGAQSNGKTR